MGQPNSCNCQCGYQTNKKYTCYNGFCVEDTLGEYSEPTCGGNCPAPTQYACVSGYCIPTVGGAYNNPTCNSICPVMPTTRYSCFNSFCTRTKGGSYYEPTCNSACPPRSVEYNCINGFCQPQVGGPYKNDPTCNNLCPSPTGKLYKCVNGQCIQAIDGIYLDDPTCSGNCTPGSGNYLLINCLNQNETIIATAPSGTYKPPYNNVWKVDGECWKMVGEIECPCAPPPIVLPDTKTAGCNSCNNDVCCFEVRQCTETNNYNCVNGQCIVDPAGPYVGDPTCGGGGNCGQHYWKICVSGFDPTACSSYVGKTIKINGCDDPLVIGDSGPPCSPAPGWMNVGYPCQCCFNIVNSIPETLQATYHNLVNIYLNCCECNPCSQTKNCNPGEVFVGNCNQCDCVCIDPPCSPPPQAGACCDVDCDVINCYNVSSPEQCNGEFFPGLSCTDNPCTPGTCEDGCCPNWICVGDGTGTCIPSQFGFSTKAACEAVCPKYEPG